MKKSFKNIFKSIKHKLTKNSRKQTTDDFLTIAEVLSFLQHKEKFNILKELHYMIAPDDPHKNKDDKVDNWLDELDDFDKDDHLKVHVEPFMGVPFYAKDRDCYEGIPCYGKRRCVGECDISPFYH